MLTRKKGTAVADPPHWICSTPLLSVEGLRPLSPLLEVTKQPRTLHPLFLPLPLLAVPSCQQAGVSPVIWPAPLSICLLISLPPAPPAGVTHLPPPPAPAASWWPVIHTQVTTRKAARTCPPTLPLSWNRGQQPWIDQGLGLRGSVQLSPWQWIGPSAVPVLRLQDRPVLHLGPRLSFRCRSQLFFGPAGAGLTSNPSPWPWSQGHAFGSLIPSPTA